MIESAKTRIFGYARMVVFDGIAERKKIKHEAIKEYTCYSNITDAIVYLCNCNNGDVFSIYECCHR